MEFTVSAIGHVFIEDADTKEVILDKHNAIHPRNMSRIISRALAREPNSYIRRMAFGNGASSVDIAGQVIISPPNDGRDGSWESRLYNETYSEIIDELDPDFGKDLGSAEAGNIRIGGGSVPEDDPDGMGVVSQEVGTKSNVIISVFLNKNEPTGQLLSDDAFGPVIDETDEIDETTFIFDEIGLYSPGKQAADISGYSSVDVGNKTSEDDSLLAPSTIYRLNLTINGVEKLFNLTTPASGSGTLLNPGPSSYNALTYGDIAEGINSGSWITPLSGTNINDPDDGIYCYITDRSGGTYTTIIGQESYGLLTFRTNAIGAGTSVELNCVTGADTTPPDFFKALTNSTCSLVNINQTAGGDAGIANDTIDVANERERLLTHITFPPIAKTANKALNIVYTITVSVARTNDSRTNIENTTVET